jgi:RHS repeat-associated protein
VTAINVNGTLSYLVSDTLGSVSVALSSSGSVQADQLFTPYGATRYASGTMPTSYGFTGQRLDPSGLQYFNARYYDSSAGQFTSADQVQGPNRYAYVSGNPETITDPTGQFGACAGSMPDGRCTHPRPGPNGRQRGKSF